MLCVLLLLVGSLCAPRIEPLGKWEGFGGHRAQGSATASSVILDSLEPLSFGIKWGDTHTALGEVVGGAAE